MQLGIGREEDTIKVTSFGAGCRCPWNLCRGFEPPSDERDHWLGGIMQVGWRVVPPTLNLKVGWNLDFNELFFS